MYFLSFSLEEQLKFSKNVNKILTLKPDSFIGIIRRKNSKKITIEILDQLINNEKSIVLINKIFQKVTKIFYKSTLDKIDVQNCLNSKNLKKPSSVELVNTKVF